jgi:SRSO17 transposase
MFGGDEWQADLEHWLAPFLNLLSHPARRAMCPRYVAGLIGPGDRKSIQPMAHRLGMTSHDRLHHFVSAGTGMPGLCKRNWSRKRIGWSAGRTPTW